MNRLKITLSLLLTALILSSCNIKEKINNALRFSYYESFNFTLPSTTIVDLPIDIETPNRESSGQQAFENNNTSASAVDGVYLSELKLTITSPDTRNFSFVESIKIYISTGSSDEILLAENPNIPTTVGKEIELETTSNNLKTYAASSAYDLRYEVVTRETTNSQTDITADLTFEVQAKEL